MSFDIPPLPPVWPVDEHGRPNEQYAHFLGNVHPATRDKAGITLQQLAFNP